jgi:hypothetical protein
MRRFDTVDKIVYITGIITILIIITYFVLTEKLGFNIESACLFKKLFGLYCPLCGGTRATVLLRHGKILMSLFYNPLVIYTTALGSVYMTINTAAVFFKRIKIFEFKDIYGYIFLVIMFMNFIIKNIMVIFYGVYVLD